MNNKKKQLVFILFLVSFLAHSQSDAKKDSLSIKKIIKDVDIDFYGFLRHDIMYDSRQTVDVREAAVVMWGKDVDKDINGKDINSAHQFQMLSILSRAGIKIQGPMLFGAKVNGILEGDYFGNAESGINEFRLRHAWITFNWGKTQIGVGQFWHPLTIPQIFPGTVNFSGGAPYMPYNRNPQIRLTQKLSDKFNMIVTVLSQRDFTADTSPYINSGVPSANLQFNYSSPNFIIGVAGHYENVRPQIKSGTSGIYSDERLNSISGMLYSRLETNIMTAKAEATLAQNAASFIMLGGFVGYTPQNGKVETYNTMNTQAYWIDLTAKTKKIVPGLFVGYSKNDGVDDPNYDNTVIARAYGFPSQVGGIGAGDGGRTINEIYRIAPRVEYVSKHVKFGFEVEYSSAEWGDADNSGRAVSNIDTTENTRLIFATVYTF